MRKVSMLRKPDEITSFLRERLQEEIDLNKRLFIAVDAFRFKEDLVPRHQIDTLKKRQCALETLLAGVDQDDHSATAKTLSTLEELSIELEREREAVIHALPDPQPVSGLYHDPYWNHEDPLGSPGELSTELSGFQSRKNQDALLDKPLSENVTLGSALRALPANFIGVIHRNLGLPREQRKKRERIEAIRELLGDSTRFATLLMSLPSDLHRLLEQVMRSGFVADYTRITHGYGDDPVLFSTRTTLGCARAHGLLFTGRPPGARGNRPHVVLPQELREPARRALLPANVILFPAPRGIDL